MPSVIMCMRWAARLLERGVMVAVIVAMAALQSEDMELMGWLAERR